MTFPGSPKTLAWEPLHYFCSDHNFQKKSPDPWCDNYKYMYWVIKGLFEVYNVSRNLG